MTEHSKPKWEDAPEWANWLAQDECGEWFFFGSPPKQHQTYMVWSSTSFCKKAGWGSRNENWRDTLEQRPEVISLMNGDTPSGVVIEKRQTPPQERTLKFCMTPDELFSIGDFSEIVEAVMVTPGDFFDVLTEAQITELVKSIPDKFLKDECFERGIEVNPFERED